MYVLPFTFQDANVTIQKASSTTRPRKQGRTKTPARGGGKKPSSDSNSTDLSWFDLDAVYGFGSTDYN